MNLAMLKTSSAPPIALTYYLFAPRDLPPRHRPPRRRAVRERCHSYLHLSRARLRRHPRAARAWADVLKRFCTKNGRAGAARAAAGPQGAGRGRRAIWGGFGARKSVEKLIVLHGGLGVGPRYVGGGGGGTPQARVPRARRGRQDGPRSAAGRCAPTQTRSSETRAARVERDDSESELREWVERVLVHVTGGHFGARDILAFSASGETPHPQLLSRSVAFESSALKNSRRDPKQRPNSFNGKLDPHSTPQEPPGRSRQPPAWPRACGQRRTNSCTPSERPAGRRRVAT